ncbi:glutamate--cysteine ligase [Hyphomicrobium methylovorum]|uniref:glutamate--cysteine ligase n=1 Tax=Hyphomicrobium methylovorum TaxID=84 RepID=UPI0015E6BD4C|nr:glutamate--cysteine ligase [Hyphomicrobium methylovorum]MBA2126864.1 glutamate--cysteine ligase [Hyphomicrobium methylovorum]
MSTREQGAEAERVESRDDLVRWIAAGEKPKSDWRIGTEHEKFVFRTMSLAPVPYGGNDGIRALMEQLIARFGWIPIQEGDNIIALKRPEGEKGGTISLEPGGQFELSGQPLDSLHETADETDEHLREVLGVGEDLAIGFLGVGFSPKWRLDEVPHMPKKRYEVMTRYMPTVGSRGLDMMYRTATIQVNLDFGSEADMVKKLRVSLALQPIATALFASSPFTEGRPNGFQSMRSEVWRATDRRRTGMLPFAFEAGMGYERYVDYALDVPMYFVYRDGNYFDVAGASFRDFMAGRLKGLEGVLPTADDWSDHLTTLFPEVRLKRFLEMRGADGGRWGTITALPAFWTGILYDDAALDQAWQLVRDWTAVERETLRNDVPKEGFAAKLRGRSVREITRDALAISRLGLQNRGRRNEQGADETVYLEPLDYIVASGQTVSDDLLQRYNGRWEKTIDHIFEEFAF